MPIYWNSKSTFGFWVSLSFFIVLTIEGVFTWFQHVCSLDCLMIESLKLPDDTPPQSHQWFGKTYSLFDSFINQWNLIWSGSHGEKIVCNQFFQKRNHYKRTRSTHCVIHYLEQVVLTNNYEGDLWYKLIKQSQKFSG